MKQRVKQFLKFRSRSNPQVETNGLDPPSIANDFKNLTTILKNSQSIEECILFYNEKILQLYPNNDEQLCIFFQTYDLYPNITKLLEAYAPLFELSILDESKWLNGFTFLQSAIKYINPDDNIKQNSYDFIFTILESNNIPLLEMSRGFFVSFLHNQLFIDDIMKGQNLVKIWENIFMTNIDISKILGDSFISILPNIKYSGIDDIQPFLDNVLLTLNKDMKDSLNLLPKSLEFISKIMLVVDTGTFTQSLIDSIRSYLVDIPELFFLKYLLAEDPNKVGIVWEVINHLFSNPATSITKIKTLIDIFKSVKNISKLKASSLLAKFSLISKEDLQTLLDIIKQQSNEYKFAFICNACPPWDKHVTPDFFEQVLISGYFDDGQIQTILDIYIRSGETFSEYVHINQVKRSVYFLLSHMTDEMEIASDLLDTFLKHLNKDNLKPDDEAALKDIVNKLFMIGNHQYLATAIVNFLISDSSVEIKDRVFAVLAVETLKYDDIANYVRKQNIFSCIEKHLDKISCVDFLASLANDGPCKEIDEFINKIQFENSPLAKLDDKSLTNLILGLPHDSESEGLIRITPLCKYIEDVPIKTPFDRYMVARKLKKMNKKTFFKCSSFYIRSNKILFDSSYLREISDPDFFHFSVYQSHFAMRHSFAVFPSAVSTSIWIYFERLISETIVLSSPNFHIIVGLNEIRVNSNEPHEFSLMEWHLLTVFRNSHTFGTNTIEIYLDDKKISDVECKNPLNEKIMIGSDDANYAIWYIAQSIQTMSTQPMKNDLQNIIKAGPSAFSPIRLECGPGMPFLLYRGIASFQNNFNIFSLILSSTNETDFVNYICTANNLRIIGVISNETFYSGLRYVSIQKELKNIDINFKKCIFEDFLHNINFITDYQILSLKSMKFEWIKTDILNNPTLINDCVNYLIDSMIFLQLDENKYDLFIEVVNKYTLNHPEFINKVFMMIEVVQNNPKLQQKLYSIFSKNTELFQPQITRQRLYQLIQNVNDDDVALQILDFLSPQQFDFNCFEESSIRFILLVKYQSFWLSMFSFLICNKITDSIESSTQYPVKQQTMLPIMIRLAAYSMQFDISNMVLRNLFVLLNKIQIGYYVDSIRHLCSLGYKNQNPSKYPFRLRNVSLSPNANTNRRGSVQLETPSQNENLETETNSSQNVLSDDEEKVQEKEQQIQDDDSILFGNKFANIIWKMDYKNVRIQPLSLEYYDETMQYLNESFKGEEEIMKSSKDEREKIISQFFPEFEGIKKIDEIHIEMIAEASSQLLLKTSKNISKFKSNLIKLTIQGSDVVKEVSVMVHRAIILKFIQDITYSSIPSKAVDCFGYFLINRIYEGWWDDHIYDVFKAILPFFTPSNFAKDFFLTCIMKCKEEEKKKIISSFMEDSVLHKKAKFFADTVSKEPFQFIMIEILYRNNLIESFKETILSSFPKNCEFIKSVRENRYEDFLANHPFFSSPSNNKYYIESTQRIIKNAIDNNKVIIQTRNDLTLPSPLPSIHQYFSLIDKRVAYQYMAFKYQFCIRLNKENQKIESFIHELISDQNRLLRPDSNSIKYSITTAASPLTVPQKLVPTSFSYDLPADQHKLTLPFPLTTYKPNENKKVLHLQNEDDELLRERIAPSSFTSINLQCGLDKQDDNDELVYLNSSSTKRFTQNIYLPTFSKVANVTKSFKMKFDPTNSSHIFECRFLSHYESIPCCGLITKDDNFIILFHANIINENSSKPPQIELIESDNEEGASYSSLATGLAYSSIIDGYCGRWDLFMNHVVLYVPFNEISSCFPRTHTYLNIGLEIFTLYGCHLSFLFSEKWRKVYLSKMKPAQQFKNVEFYTKQWMNGELNNFDYLLLLNSISSRSFNDLSQYPVFPWILSDYNSEEIDVDSLSSGQLRRLDKPIGVQTDDRIERFQIVYNETDPPYHYGSHYSQPAAVTHFMVRIDPFTKLSIFINSGWDNKDRLFWSLNESWRSVSESRQTDVKELIPEFFCFAEFLENENKLKMPKRSDGRNLDRVKLPPWAKGSSFKFVWTNREALESRKVRENLNGWIDLIFGFKQKGQAAIEAINVYQHHCYDNGSSSREKTKDMNEDDELDIEAETSAMLNFGVCPIQLFFKPHPSFSKNLPSSANEASNDASSADAGNNEKEKENVAANNDANITNSELKMTDIKELPKSSSMVRYDSSKKEFVTSLKNELFLNFPEKVIIRGNYISISGSNSPSTAIASSATPSSSLAEQNISSETAPITDTTAQITPASSSSIPLTSSVIRFSDIIISSCASYTTKMAAFALLNGCINVVRKIDTLSNVFTSLPTATTATNVPQENTNVSINSGFQVEMGMGAEVSASDVADTIATLACQLSGKPSITTGQFKQQLLPTICTHEHVVSMAISEKHFMLAAATKKNKIILFDLTSGRYLRCNNFDDIRPDMPSNLNDDKNDSNQVETKKNDADIRLNNNDDENKCNYVGNIVFDDSANLLIIASECQIKVVSLNLSFVASVNDVDNPVTSIDVTDPTIWDNKPYFVTGHANGKCCLWEIDIIQSKIRKIWRINCNLGPIVTVNIFFKNKAVLVIDDNGASVVLSIANIKSPFLNKNLFCHCTVCHEKLEAKKTFICGCCCLAVCSKCYNKKASCCITCQPTV